MLKNNFKYIVFLLLLAMISCAKRGRITGGLKDTIAPVLKMTSPENYNTNFKGNKIKLTFDEFIKLKDLKNQLIISPPMKYDPLILPTTTSKYLTIEINDTLKPNTTYSLNFGQSIIDNNEGNPYNQLKYVFSTGTYIDSLSLSGSIKDALQKEAEPFVSVMLYDMNDSFNDSLVYNENPRYITNTSSNTTTFKLENLKAGKYLLVAMKDYNSNNKFDPAKDKIGFNKQYITIPNDSTYELKLFKETPPFKAGRLFQASENRLILSYEGKEKNAAITLKNGTDILPTIITKFPKKDSLQIWFKPLKVDSLALVVNKDKYDENFNVKLKPQKKDSLNISVLQKGVLNFRDKFTIESKTPLIRFDNSKITIRNKDSVLVAFTTQYDEFNQKLSFDFKKDPLEKYTLEIMPGALTDFLEQSNDTLSYTTSTRNLSDYGNLIVNLKNVKHFPVIVQLTNKKGELIATEYSEKETKIDFSLLDPALYTLRVIYDDNKNEEWDSGNYLEKRYAEEVIYFPKEIDVRANWDVDQLFDLNILYDPESKE